MRLTGVLFGLRMQRPPTGYAAIFLSPLARGLATSASVDADVQGMTRRSARAGETCAERIPQPFFSPRPAVAG